MKTFPGSINAFLGNSARGDLIGPEMWTVSDVERIPGNIPDSMFESAISPQLPHYAWGPPRMGLAGIWCLGHQTNLKDVLQLVISRVDGAEREALDFVATRNHWTPAYMTTYYRARASRKPGEHPYAGPLTVRESKCITEENVFVSEVTLTNDQRRPRDYRVEIRLPHFQPGGQPGAFAVQVETVPRGLSERLPIQTFAALVTSRGGPDLVFRLGPFQSATFQYAFCVDADPSAALQTATAHLRAGG